MLWCNTQQQQQHNNNNNKIIKKLTEISHRQKCMTDLFSFSTPNETLHKVTIDVYEAVYHFQLLLQSDSGGIWGGQLAVSACRSENLKIRSVKLSTLIPRGVNLQIYPGKSENCLWYLHVSSMHWYLLISSYYLTVSNGCSLTALKSIELTQCSGSFNWGGVNLKIYLGKSARFELPDV